MIAYPQSLDTRPLTTWPGALTPAHQRKRASFTAGLGSTLEVLDRELWHLQAKHPVLEVAIPADQWRRDGRPRAGAREDHPGVVLSLPTTRHGALRYPADTFDRWQDNLRAIALGLEALRKVDRYGITRHAEQYAGFKQLGPGAAVAVAPTMSVDEAARALLSLVPLGHLVAPADVLGRAEDRRNAYRLAAQAVHPDRGGRREDWDRLEQAKRVLDEHAPVTS